MNLEALTQIPLADLGMGVIALVLVIGGSWYARRHGVSLRSDSPTHQFMNDDHYDPSHRHVPGNAFHHSSHDD